MKYQSESPKIVLKAIQISWVLYYSILLSRILSPLIILLVFYFESIDIESTAFWGTMLFFILAIFVQAIWARPYFSTGNLVITTTRIFYEGKLVELSNCDQINLCLSKPMSHSFLDGYFAFYQHGFGSYIQASNKCQTLINVNFLLERKTELHELKSILTKGEQANNYHLKSMSFKQPKFPNWNSFLKKKKGL